MNFLSFFFFVIGNSACFNQGLSRSIIFLDILEFFRQVYCTLRFKQISQDPFLVQVRPIIFTSLID